MYYFKINSYATKLKIFGLIRIKSSEIKSVIISIYEIVCTFRYFFDVHRTHQLHTTGLCVEGRSEFASEYYQGDH